MSKSMLIFLVITLWFGNVWVCSRMRIHTYSFLVLSSAIRHFVIPFASKCALLGNDLAIKHKMREFLVTVSVHPLNSSSVNETPASVQRAANRMVWIPSFWKRKKLPLSCCIKTASLFTQKRYEVYSLGKSSYLSQGWFKSFQERVAVDWRPCSVQQPGLW